MCIVESILNWIRRQENAYFLVLKKVLKARLWDPILKKTVTNRDVIFDETFMLKLNEAETCDDSS